MCVTSENKTTPSDINYTDVVIIGNGPSGICLSYMLAGNWPYYKGEAHPGDEMLTARLHYCTQSTCNENSNVNDRRREQCDSNNSNSDSTSNKSASAAKGKRDTSRCLARITRNKLECLCTGLEGRGGARTLPLLMDQLQHPGVDAGLDVPSLLAWKSTEQRPEHKVIDHVVLGKGQPGGAWQTMDPNVLTISLSRWMSLPGLDLRHWEMLVKSQNSDDVGLSQDIKIPYKTTSRVSVGTVAAYYKDYVTRQGLEKYFRCGTTVTSVRPLPNATDSSKESEYKWLVEGFENETGERFLYHCKRVVLATGTTDLSNHLPGEEPRYDWVTHNLNDLESKLDKLVAQHKDAEEGTLENRVNPVLIIGSGLSAADAIMAARFRGIPVLHAFRNTSTSRGKDKFNFNFYDKLQLLPNSIYPEYHKVYEMMADGGTNYPLYKSLKDYSLVKLDPNERVVTLRDSNDQLHKFGVSVTGIFIGYKPDLSYLENNGVGLGRIPDKPIDSRSNPINIDNFTYEVLNSQQKGMYALGPLVGDNFVRYILGGAFGILVHILHSSTTSTTTATT